MNKEKVLNFISEIWIYIVVLIVVILLKLFVVTPVKVNGQSMYSTLHDGDIMILNKIGYRFNSIKRFDIVVVSTPEEDLIKRVIGLPRDSIKYENNNLYVNDEIVVEDFKHAKTDDFSLENLEASVVPSDSYFVLGDNRVNSTDSRIIGFIDKKQILGKASLTIYPFNRIGNKK